MFFPKPLLRDAGESVYQQVYEQVRQAILSGSISPGSRMPSSRVLAKEIKVARNIVMAVYEQLIAEGYLTGKSRSGTFVSGSCSSEIVHILRASSPERSAGRRRVARRVAAYGDLAFSFTDMREAPRAFQLGFSAVDEFPVDIWARLSSRIVRTMPRRHLDYCEPAGYPPLRAEIANYLRASRGVRCQDDQVIIVAGSQQGLDLISRTLLDPGDEAWTEDPNYLGALGALLGAGVKVVHVPLDAQGMDIRRGQQLSKNPRLAYVTPSHQFPSGVVMSLSRRLELLDWAEQNSAWVVEDDYDSEFRYENKPLMTLQGMDSRGHVVYLGTFSKILFPSLRIGYLVVPPDLVSDFIRTLSFSLFHVPAISQMVLTSFIAEGHFGRHVRRMRKIYQERQSVLKTGIETLLGDYLTVQHDPAGMHLVSWLKQGLRDREVAERALESGIYAPPLSFYCSRIKLPDALLMGYTGLRPEEIMAGLERMREMFHSAYSRSQA